MMQTLSYIILIFRIVSCDKKDTYVLASQVQYTKTSQTYMICHENKQSKFHSTRTTALKGVTTDDRRKHDSV